VLNGSSPATTELAPALTAGPGLKGAVGPFVAWTAPSGEIYYADGDFSPWSGVLVNNGLILSNQAPALTLAEVSNPPCQTLIYLVLAFTDKNAVAGNGAGTNNAIYTNTNGLPFWDITVTPCSTE